MKKLPDILIAIGLSGLILAAILFLTSCDKSAPDMDKLELRTKYGLLKNGDRIPMGADVFVYYQNLHAFRYETKYFCCYDSVATAKSYYPQDTLWWCKQIDTWIRVKAWDDNGNSATKTIHFKVE